MTAEYIAANLASWRVVEAFVAGMPDNERWSPWKAVARRFVAECARFGLDAYFRAGNSMDELVFSTLDHHGLRYEPRVAVKIHTEERIRVAYVDVAPTDPHYTLPFDQAFPTFMRFLNQLWTATMPEAVPETVRAPLTLLKVPVFT